MKTIGDHISEARDMVSHLDPRMDPVDLTGWRPTLAILLRLHDQRSAHWIGAVLEELARARAKYPQGDRESRYVAFSGECGEAFQAHAKWLLDPTEETLAAAKAEVIQAIATGVRLLEEVYELRF